MDSGGRRLTIIGDVGVDIALGPISSWPRIGPETIMERSELRAGGAAGNSALAVGYLGGACHLISVVGNDDAGAWLHQQLRGVGAPATCSRGSRARDSSNPWPREARRRRRSSRASRAARSRAPRVQP
jgi:bifunctional ADP-heptose synthase (sugar kinase/adenylyltransferase)